MVLKNNEAQVEFTADRLSGTPVDHKATLIDDLKAVFENEEKRALVPSGTVVYEVDAYKPVPDDTPGGLFFGITRIQPGQVGDEYFMTRGHFHALSDRSEFYWGIKGEGMLILMDRSRKVWVEKMYPGSLHYIPAHIAHRVANTGSDILSFGACWPADAGYDYEEIRLHGFSGRLLNVNGFPQLKLEK